MTTIHHHPEEATLAAYAAGSLPTALALVVGCHLEYCTRCREAVAQAEALGGALMDDLPQQALKPGAGAAMLARLDLDEDVVPAAPAPSRRAPAVNPQLPTKLQRLLGDQSLEHSAWRSAGPGVRLLKLGCAEGNAVLMDIAPGYQVPVHSHRGTELTLIINGDYQDNLGRFASGDVADLDDRTEHQPKAGAQGCLCLAGLDAPVKYKGLIPRLLQPLFQL